MGHALARLPLGTVIVACPDCGHLITVHQEVVVTEMVGRDTPRSAGHVVATFEHACD